MDTEYTITGIVEEAPEGAQYAATVNGQYRSGFCADSRGENGRIYAAIQEAIAGGATVEPYIEPTVTEADEAEALLRKTDSEIARVTEDLIALLISKGVIAKTELPREAQDKINEREALRARIE